jgi:hypothetical protein
MKPKYEKPVAMPLGEAVKGSGECNAGSGVVAQRTYTCGNGNDAFNCKSGSAVTSICLLGTGGGY